MNYWPLIGILIVVIGFALRFNPLMVVVTAALATGVLGGLDFIAVVEALGKAFNDKVSSLRFLIPSDMKIVFWEDKDFGGQSLEFKGENKLQEFSKLDTLGDEFSSFKLLNRTR